jgi:hypothetical protein
VGVDEVEGDGEIRAPRKRWGGKWRESLNGLVSSGGVGDEWVEVSGDYARTSAYQTARDLNSHLDIPAGLEFGSRVNADGTSSLFVRRAGAGGSGS